MIFAGTIHADFIFGTGSPAIQTGTPIMTVKELREKRAALVKQARAISAKADTEKRSLNADEQTAFDKIMGTDVDGKHTDGEVDVLKADIGRAERLDNIEGELRSVGGVVPGTETQPVTPTGVRTDADGRVMAFFEETDERITMQFGEDANAVRRQSYSQTKRRAKDFLGTAGYQPWNEFRSFTEFIRAGLSGHGQANFDDRVRRHFDKPLSHAKSVGVPFEFRNENRAVLGMSESVASDGGYMVLPEYAMKIIDRIYSNDLWSRTDNYNVVGNNMTFLANAETSRATGSRHGGLRGYWINEGGSITSSKPTLREISIKLMKLGVVVYLTDDLLKDGGAALEQYVARKAAEEFNFMIGDSLINGTGVGQPLGVLNSPSLISVAKEGGQLAATLQTENVEKIYNRFYAPNIGGLEWYHNQDILSQLNLMTLGIGIAGVPTYLPPGGASAAPFGMLKGRPIKPTEFNATLGTQGDIIAADLGQMLSISKGGVVQAVSLELQFLTDQVAIRFIMRLNATPWESAPITPFKGSNTQSSFVTLDTRS